MGKENLENMVPRFFSIMQRSPLEVDRQVKTNNHSSLRVRFVLLPVALATCTRCAVSSWPLLIDQSLWVKKKKKNKQVIDQWVLFCSESDMFSILTWTWFLFVPRAYHILTSISMLDRNTVLTTMIYLTTTYLKNATPNSSNKASFSTAPWVIL